MDELADSQPRLGTHKRSVIADAFPALRPDQVTADALDRITAGARCAAPLPEAVHPPPQPHTSILQAERQVKILVFVAALAAWAYFFHAAS